MKEIRVICNMYRNFFLFRPRAQNICSPPMYFAKPLHTIEIQFLPHNKQNACFTKVNFLALLTTLRRYEIMWNANLM